MKTLKLFALVGIFVSLILPNETYGQLSGSHPYYVVIGAFRYQRNAIRFTNNATKVPLGARYEMNRDRGLYYVYTLNTEDKQVAINEALRLRDESEYKDTWVYGSVATEDGSAGVDINPVTESATSPATGSDNAVAAPPVVTANANPTPALTSEVDDGIVGKRFHFKIYRNLDKAAVEGEVDIIDQEKLKKVGSYKGNMTVKLVSPPGKSKNIAAICEVFGYRKLQRDFNYESPQGDGFEVAPDGAVTIPFELMRLQKGDIATMYHVYYFKDAAIMRPESRYEVNSLLEMLQENPKYKIRIHGHTNGNSRGKIIYSEPEAKNYFSLNNTQETVGSAKRLSQERAELMRNFLITNGIDAGRMETKAWGGKRMIHDKHHTRAQENVRVEIEILED